MLLPIGDKAKFDALLARINEKSGVAPETKGGVSVFDLGKEGDAGRQRQCEQQHRPAVCTFSPAPHPIPSSGEPMQQTQLYAAAPKAKKHLKMPIENVHLRDTEAAARQRA